MKRYRAWITDSDTANEGIYDFDGPDDLFSQTPVRIVRAFMEHVDKNLLPAEHIDYELNAAMKHSPHAILTAMGSFLVQHGPGIPFTLFITPAE